jgi:hypothetical protein
MRYTAVLLLVISINYVNDDMHFHNQSCQYYDIDNNTDCLRII